MRWISVGLVSLCVVLASCETARELPPGTTIEDPALRASLLSEVYFICANGEAKEVEGWLEQGKTAPSSIVKWWTIHPGTEAEKFEMARKALNLYRNRQGL